MKKNWLLRVLSALACLALTVGFAACGGDDGESGKNGGGGGDAVIVYEISYDGTYATVTGCKQNETRAVIESTYEGVPVTGIGEDAFCNCDSLTSIEIPDSVTSIGEDAFYNCTSLTSITFKDTSTWYRTTSSSDWITKTGGTKTTVTNSSTNATYFTSTYCVCYWYKK